MGSRRRDVQLPISSRDSRHFKRASARAASAFTDGPSSVSRPSAWLAASQAWRAAAWSPCASAASPSRYWTVPAETPGPGGSVVSFSRASASAESPARSSAAARLSRTIGWSGRVGRRRHQGPQGRHGDVGRLEPVARRDQRRHPPEHRPASTASGPARVRTPRLTCWPGCREPSFDSRSSADSTGWPSSCWTTSPGARPASAAACPGSTSMTTAPLRSRTSITAAPSDPRVSTSGVCRRSSACLTLSGWSSITVELVRLGAARRQQRRAGPRMRRAAPAAPTPGPARQGRRPAAAGDRAGRSAAWRPRRRRRTSRRSRRFARAPPSGRRPAARTARTVSAGAEARARRPAAGRRRRRHRRSAAQTPGRTRPRTVRLAPGSSATRSTARPTLLRNSTTCVPAQTPSMRRRRLAARIAVDEHGRAGRLAVEHQRSHRRLQRHRLHAEVAQLADRDPPSSR